MVTYSKDHRTAFCDDYKFRKDLKTGYYLANKPTHAGKRERLHVYVWRVNNGEIPDGYHVHHKDGNKDNNELENLACIPRFDHFSYHGKKHAQEHPDEVKARLDNARIYASLWHGSPEGRAWHMKHAQEMDVQPREFVCEYCGKHFWTKPMGTVKYCSNGCKTKARYRSGLDNEERVCVVCGKTFTANKYSRIQSCSTECGCVLRWNHIREKRGKSAGV